MLAKSLNIRKKLYISLVFSFVTLSLSACQASISAYPGVYQEVDRRGHVETHVGLEANIAIREVDRPTRSYEHLSPQIYLEQGRSYRESGDWRRAVHWYERGLDEYPARAELYYARAQAYISGEDYALALDDLDECLDLSPDLNDAYLLRAEVQLKLNRNYALVIRDAERVIRFKPEEARAYRYRARARYHLGYHELALEDFYQAAELGNEAEAELILSEAILLGYSDYQLYLDRGRYRHQLGDLSFSIQDINEALRMEPQRAEAYRLRAEVYYARGMCSRAEKDLRTACRLDGEGGLCEQLSLECGSADADLAEGEVGTALYGPDTFQLKHNLKARLQALNLVNFVNL